MADNSNPRKLNLRRLLLVILGLVVSAVFVGLALRNIDLGKAIDEIARVSLPILALSLITKFLGFCLVSWRSRLLLRPLHDYSFVQALRSVFVAFVGNNILPARIGELLRTHYLARQGDIPHTSCIAVLVFERLLDMFCLLIIFFCIVPVLTIEMPSYAPLVLLASGVFGGIVGAALISRFPDVFVKYCKIVTGVFGAKASSFITTKAERFARGLNAISSIKTVGVVLVLSLGFWFTGLLSVQIWLWAFGFELPWYTPLAITIFVSFGTLLPSSPGYVGTYHYFVITALGLFGVASTQAASFAIVGHAMAFLPFTLLGVPFVLQDILAGAQKPLSQHHEDPEPL